MTFRCSWVSGRKIRRKLRCGWKTRREIIWLRCTFRTRLRRNRGRAGGNRRKEALPHWCHSRGVRYSDGLYLPTQQEPLTDGISGATPRGSFDVRLRPDASLTRFVVKVEVNHSTDFNAAYPASAKKGDPGWSDGKHGSGQPAVVYAAEVDLNAGQRDFEALPIGHSSPDGTSGDVEADMSALTTALRIVERITIRLR